MSGSVAMSGRGGASREPLVADAVAKAYSEEQLKRIGGVLRKKLGPEFISSRPGQGGRTLHYVEGHKLIEIANDVLGFNGWSSCVKSLKTLRAEHNAQGQWTIVVAVTMRVTLSDGSYREDVGIGSMVNGPKQDAAYEKAYKEGTMDAIKRTLRQFGAVVGLCVYNKNYLARVGKMPQNFEVLDFNEEDLYRLDINLDKKRARVEGVGRDGSSVYSEMERERISKLLRRRLGPEFISERPGQGNKKLQYVEEYRVIELANVVFGFDGWSTEVRSVKIKFLERNEQTCTWSTTAEVTVRVTIRGGSFHQGVGYGQMANERRKGTALEKAVKEGYTDATKRALRQFGDLLGLCLYDEKFLEKFEVLEFNEDDLYRLGVNRKGKRKRTNDESSDEDVRVSKTNVSGKPVNIGKDDGYDKFSNATDEVDFDESAAMVGCKINKLTTAFEAGEEDFESHVFQKSALTRSIKLIAPIAEFPVPSQCKTIALLERGGGFPFVSAMSGWSHDKNEEIQLTGQYWMDKAFLIAKFVGHTLAPDKKDQGLPGRFHACHAEKQLIAYFISSHYIDEGTKGIYNLLREGGQKTAEDEQKMHEEVGMSKWPLRALAIEQPPISLRKATILTSTPVCDDCQKFVKLVNSSLKLNITVLDKSGSRPSHQRFTASNGYSAAFCR